MEIINFFIVIEMVKMNILYFENLIHYCPVKAGKSVFEIVET